ncbi:MAG: PAS domain-containing protein [Ideonella sp.]
MADTPEPDSAEGPADGALGDAPASSELDDQVGKASLDELRRALRLVVGSEGAYWERNLITDEIWYSAKFYEMLGLDASADRNQVHDAIHPDDRAEFGRLYQAAIDSKGRLQSDIRYRHRNGAYRWVRIQGRVWGRADGRAERLIGMATEVDAEKRAQLALQRMTEQFDRAMEASLEVQFERKLGDEAFSIGRQINTLLGYPVEAPSPNRVEFGTWVHPDDKAALRTVVKQANKSPGFWSCEYRLRHADGTYRWVGSRGRTERLNDGAIRMTGMIGDIHEQKMSREELVEQRKLLETTIEERTASLEAALREAQRQRLEAERANEAKSTFLAHMSHEIRTPLNGLLGLNELALREAASDQQRRYLKLALQSGAGLLDMLNGVLDFSRLNAGRIETRPEAFDLAEALATSLRQAMPQARQKGLGMMYDYVGPVTLVIGDLQRLLQVTNNLMANAVKYTDSGHIALRAEVSPSDAHHCIAEIECRDTGSGMSAEVAARIFEPFVQGDESLARRHGGSGLGLSIARGLAQSMGGDLRVQTAPGEGTSFRLSIAFGLQAGVQPMNQLPDPGLAWLIYTRRIPAEWIAKRLDRIGWRSEILDMQGLDARAAAMDAGAAEPPDLVIIAEAALESPEQLDEVRMQLAHTPVVLLVRPDWNQPRIEAAARANDMPLVFMPLTPGALLELALMHGRKTGGADSAFSSLPSSAPTTGDILIAEDNAVNQLIITEMIGALGLGARLAEDGAQAVAACVARAPDLVLMDLQMPVVDGIEATRQLLELQRQGRLPRFPIVALTAHATPQDRERCLNAGMQGYLTKPISLAQLRIELGRWLKL